MSTTPDTATPCAWCEETTAGHKHFAVLCSEGDKRLGRLTPEGTATIRNVYAAVFSRAKAAAVAEKINAADAFTAKVIPF